MPVFLDTNILIYAYDTSDDAKHQAAVGLMARLLSEKNVVISTQVLNEFVVVITGKVNYPLSIDDAAAILNKFNDNFVIHLTGLSDITTAFSLIKKFKLSYWDALIIAAATNSHCSVLYTEDLQDGLEINKDLRIINPFK